MRGRGVPQTWREFLDHGASVTGFRPTRWKLCQKIREGDVLLAYITGVSRWSGALQVTGRAFRDDKPIWKREPFPCRLIISQITQLPSPCCSLTPLVWTCLVLSGPTRIIFASPIAVFRSFRSIRQAAASLAADRLYLDAVGIRSVEQLGVRLQELLSSVDMAFL